MTQFGPQIRTIAVLAATTIIFGCSPDSAGIRRLPLEPGAALAKISISPKATSLGFIGAQKRLTATVADQDGRAASGLSFTWQSLDPGIATVDKQGNVVAVAEGTARLAVRVVNLVDTATVTVKRIPATIGLSTTSVLFTELGVTSAITATVADGGGQSLPSSDVVWTTSDSSVAKVSTSGVITAVGQGSASVKGTAGAVQASVAVRVATGPSTLAVTPPTLAFTALGDTVRLAGAVLDAAGGVLDTIAVAFLWGDTLIADVDSVGLVTSTGVGTTTVTVIGDTVRSIVPVTVTQTAATLAVTPTAVTLTPGGKVTFSATAADANANPIPSPSVSWSSTDVAVATLAGPTVTGVAAGTAMIVATSGAAKDTAMVTVTVVAIDSVDVSPDSLALDDGQSSQLSIRFFDDQGTELIGPTALWSSSDINVAKVTSSGLVTAVDPGTAWIVASRDAGADSTFVTVAAVSLMDIEVRYAGTAPSAAVQAAFDAAEARWESILIGDLSAVSVNVTAGQCGIAHPAVNETVDDLLIFAEVTAIDGVGGVLGQAGPCLVRTTGGLAVFGNMQFDDADLASLAASGDLEDVIIHEMGHVLGLGAGTPWTSVLTGAGGTDPFWPGTEAVSQYLANGGTATNRVPVANTGGAGTRDAHWREGHMGRELMTGFLNSGVQNPLSSITIGAMEDMGYTVNMAQADPYTVSSSLRLTSDRLIELRELPMPAPMAVDAQGRIVSGGN